MSTIGATLLGVFNLDKGVFHTLIALTLYPGKAIREYLYEDRSKLSKVLSFLFFFTAISAFLTINVIPFEKMMGDPTQIGDSPAEKAMLEFSHYYAKYMNPIMLTTVPITSIFSYFFFKKPQMYYAEHLVINSYIFSYHSFIYLLLTPLFIYAPSSTISGYFMVTFAYSCYAYVKIFDYETFEAVMRNLGVTLFVYLIIFLLITVAMLIFIYIKVRYSS